MNRWSSPLLFLRSDRITILMFFCFFSLLGGMAVSKYTNAAYQKNCERTFTLLSPRWRCVQVDAPKFQEYDHLRDALLWRIDDWKKTGQATQVTVHFRDLTVSSYIAINSEVRFAPASLLKVPIMIALLKYAETNPAILNEELMTKDSLPQERQNILDPEKTLAPNQVYSVQELLRKMIVYSDNASKEMLHQHLEAISPGITDQTFIDLGISLQNADGSQFITVKGYASLFRSLFNMSYLNREMSQKALTLLTQVEFVDGIVAGVPPGSIVAHKFGFLNPKEAEVQFHDCGIVYAPSTPYLLCVMTRGKDQDALISITAKISQVVAEEIALQYAD